MTISADELTFNIRGQCILHNINLSIHACESIGLIGPNGSGKSTLLRCLCGLYHGARNRVSIDGTLLAAIKQRELARKIAFVPQHADLDGDLKVRQIIKLGRTPHRNAFSAWNRSDSEAVDRAISLTKLDPLMNRDWRQLSGGERQRCHIARALVQQPEILLLDEPTNHLDIYHQIELMQLINSLNITVIIAIHDLNLAAHYCDRIIALKAGHIVGDGSPEAVLNPHLIDEIWNVEALVSRVGAGKASVQFNYGNNTQSLKAAC